MLILHTLPCSMNEQSQIGDPIWFDQITSLIETTHAQENANDHRSTWQCTDQRLSLPLSLSLFLFVFLSLSLSGSFSLSLSLSLSLFPTLFTFTTTYVRNMYIWTNMWWNDSWENYWITGPLQSSQDKVSKGCTSTWPPAKLRECHGHGTSEWMPSRRCQKWCGRRALKIDELKRACQLNCAGPEPSSCQSRWHEMTWTNTATQAAQFTTCFQSKRHLVKSPLEAKAAKCPCFFNEKAYWMV